MENPPFEDVFPIQDGDFPLLCLFTGGYVTLVVGICCIRDNLGQGTRAGRRRECRQVAKQHLMSVVASLAKKKGVENKKVSILLCPATG